MKKPDNLRENFLREKREIKFAKRQKLAKKYKDPYASPGSGYNGFKDEIDKAVLKNTIFRLHLFLDGCNFFQDKYAVSIVHIPSNFSLKNNYEKTCECISLIVASYLYNAGKELTISFKDCKSSDFSTLFFLRVLLLEYDHFLKKLQRRLHNAYVVSTRNIINSNNNDINILLLIAGFVSEAIVGDILLEPISSIGLIQGLKSVKHYLENKKSNAASQIVRYYRNVLNKFGVIITTTGVNYIEGLITEILNNAEDHSIYDKWYTSACFLQTPPKEGNKSIGELNLVFLNFGNSIFEGFEQTKDENIVIYEELMKLYDFMNSNFKHSFTKENLFTLYALQDGISRLKFESESRGTGTMKFINSFIEIGDYGGENENLYPYLSIYSGKTRLTCDKKYKPYMSHDRYFISLNEEQNLSYLPEQSHLETLPLHFPGTLLSVKLYLNEEHLTKKIFTT